MLKSPTSILNSIQRMKTNLRMDKQQLKIIKNNFVYLDGKDNSEIKEFNQNITLKQRSKSLSMLNSKKVKKNLQENQQNINLNSPLTHVQNQKLLKQSKNIQFSQNDLISENLLQEIGNHKIFKRNKQQIALINTQKQSQIMKNQKKRYLKEIEKLKQSFQAEKILLMNQSTQKLQHQRVEYEKKNQQMLQYINFLQQQINKQQNNKSYSQKIDQGCQVQQKKQIQRNDFECQTEQLYHYSPESMVSKIHDQHSPNQTSQNKKDKNLLELCQIQNQINQNEQLCCKQVRQKYQSIINCLLQQNRKLHLKAEKIYCSNSNKQNSFKDKRNFKENNWVSYGSISSRLIQESKQVGDVYGATKNFKNYFTNKQQNLKKVIQRNYDSNISQAYSSKIADSSNYDSSKQSQKNKSIIYRVSNIMSSSFMKQRKDSKTKLSIKNPPYQSKASQLQPLRLKTEYSSCESGYQNKENIDTSNFKSSNGDNSSERFERPFIKKFNQNVKDFKFYNNEEFTASNKSKDNYADGRFSDDEAEIMNDQIKLKTIKQFKCFSKN